MNGPPPAIVTADLVLALPPTVNLTLVLSSTSNNNDDGIASSPFFYFLYVSPFTGYGSVLFSPFLLLVIYQWIW
jgi:hypothetical protein